MRSVELMRDESDGDNATDINRGRPGSDATEVPFAHLLAVGDAVWQRRPGTGCTRRRRGRSRASVSTMCSVIATVEADALAIRA